MIFILVCLMATAASASVCDAFASQLDGLSWKIPCVGNTGNPNVCSVTQGTVTNSATMGGSAATTYSVTLQVLGVVEPRSYSTDITGGSQSGWVYSGLTTALTAPSTSNPANIYSLLTSTTTYYLNADPGTGVGIIDVINYPVTIPIIGGSTLTLNANTVDNTEVNNLSNLVAPGVPSSLVTQPYNGQFVYLSVVQVTASDGSCNFVQPTE